MENAKELLTQDEKDLFAIIGLVPISPLSKLDLQQIEINNRTLKKYRFEVFYFTHKAYTLVQVRNAYFWLLGSLAQYGQPAETFYSLFATGAKLSTPMREMLCTALDYTANDRRKHRLLSAALTIRKKLLYTVDDLYNWIYTVRYKLAAKRKSKDTRRL